MMCLSLWQPWASLLAAGAKCVETRGWPIRHRGPLLIHAAKKWTRELEELSETEPFFSALIANVATSEMWRAGDLPFGAIVGRVDVVDCFDTDDVHADPLHGYDPVRFVDKTATGRVCLRVSDIEKAFGDYTTGRYAFLCENPVRFANPIPYRGAQGLFEVPDGVVKDARVAA